MAKSQIKKNAAKKGMNIILPGYTNELNGTEIYQSNRVTTAKIKGLTNIQSKIFFSIIHNLQEPIRMSMSGTDYTQLQLFANDGETINIGIRLSDIAQPAQYAEVVEQAQGLMNLRVNMKSPKGEEYISIASLINRIEKPKKVDGKAVLYLRMDKDVANKLIIIDRNTLGKPVNYTKYLLEVALKARSKYTSRLYPLIASWKQKGGFRIRLEELRQIVGVEPNEYSEYAQFKRRVLLPVQKELEDRADCWFNCSARDFEIRDGKKVTTLNFKVIVPAMQEALKRQADMIKALLKNHFDFQDGHFKAIDPLFSRNFNHDRAENFMSKILSLSDYINRLKGTDDQVNDRASYALKSIINHFQDEINKL